MADGQETKMLAETLNELSLNGKTTPSVAVERKLGPHHKLAGVPKPPPPTPATVSEASPRKPHIFDSWEEEEEQVTSKEGKKENMPITADEKKAEPQTTMNLDQAPHRKYASKIAATAPASTTSPPLNKEVVADSWEDEATSDSEPITTADKPTAESNTPAEPEAEAKSPAPASNAVYRGPHHKYRSPTTPPASVSPTRSPTPPSRTSTPSSDRRPEKTTAVAHRLIAGALGVKVPRRTEEQRAYDKAVREQEKKRRDQEREAKKKADEDAAKAKAAIWDD